MARIDGFMLFRSYAESIQALPDPLDRCRLYDALCSYAFGGQEPELEGVLLAMWNLMLPSLNLSITRAEAAKRKRTKRNKRGTSPEQNPTEEEGEKEKEMEVEVEVEMEAEVEAGTPRGVSSLPAGGFRPPTVNEVAEYCQERNNQIDPEHFVNYYESSGWYVGKKPMRSWQAAVRSWERNGVGAGTGRPPGGSWAGQPAQTEYTLGPSELSAIRQLRSLAEEIKSE